MRLPMLLLIAAVLIGETQSTSAQPPNGYPWCSRSIRSDAIAVTPAGNNAIPGPASARFAFKAHGTAGRRLMRRRADGGPHNG
jgi:hypothetical protein